MEVRNETETEIETSMIGNLKPNEELIKEGKEEDKQKLLRNKTIRKQNNILQNQYKTMRYNNNTTQKRYNGKTMQYNNDSKTIQ